MIPSRFYFVPVLTAFATFSAAQQTVFYGGDPTGADTGNYFATVNGFRTRMATFDDFRWDSNLPISGLFGEFISNQTFTSGHYEIRTGVSSGVGGTLIASGNVPVSNVNLGQSNVVGNSGPFRRYHVEASTPAIMLTQGATYFLSFSIDYLGSTTGQGAILRTTGINGIGNPIANGNLFHDQPSSGLNYSPRAGDASYGIRVNAVPEPFGLTVVCFGLLALKRRRI